MLIEIDDWRTIGDLQYRFNKCFANLHLQLFSSETKTSFEKPLPPRYSLQHIRGLHRHGVLSIKSWYTCRQVEQLLESYGLSARVARLEEGNEYWLPSYANQTIGQLNERPATIRQQYVFAAMEEEQLAGW